MRISVWFCTQLPSEGELVSIGFCEDVDFVLGGASLDPTDSKIDMDLYGIAIRR